MAGESQNGFSKEYPIRIPSPMLYLTRVMEACPAVSAESAEPPSSHSNLKKQIHAKKAQELQKLPAAMTSRRLVSIVALIIAASSSAQEPLTNDNIRTAADLWYSDPTSAEAQYGHISNWDTSGVTKMFQLFNGKTTFNDDISGWDTSSVTTMQSMFRNAKAFNQDISGWDVSKVKSFQKMLNNAEVFDQDLSGWVTSSAEIKFEFRSSAT